MPLQATSGAASYDGFGGGVAAVPNYIEDVFSTWLYNGSASGQTITNGIDLSGKGGLVWFKARNQAYDNILIDTARGSSNNLVSNSTAAQYAVGGGGYISFQSTGFALNGGGNIINDAGDTEASWTFRKQPKFFDVVTWTGTGSATTIAHNLGSVPGCIIVKRTDAARDWAVYHRSLGATQGIYLNSTAAAFTSLTALWNGTTPTSTVFSVGGNADVNASGGTYVAYIFAHDAGGFGLTGTDNVISCGSFTTDGSGNATVTLGYEPQWLLLKQSTGSAASWVVVDSMRGFVSGAATTTSDDATLNPNSANAEGTNNVGRPTATGFEYGGSVASQTFIYIAIRRGPMKTPTDATKVFTPTVYTGTNVDNRLVDTTIAPDMVWVRQRNDTVLGGMVVGDRLRSQPYLLTGTTAAEVNDADAFDKQLVSTTEYGTAFSSMSGFWCGNDATAKLNANTTSNNHIAEAFKRAPGFFDVVCYTGTGSATTQAHNLGVVPEMMIVKKRAGGTTASWSVYSSSVGNTKWLALNADLAPITDSGAWNNTSPTSTVFTVGVNNEVNTSGNTYVNYLFASCPGVSKVFSFTGNGSSQTINCGFTGGARFVMIKRTDSTGDWYVWDTARGIVANNDPHLSLNSTAAEVTTNDTIDTDSTGFVVNQVSATNVNVNGASYIGLAIA